MIASEKAVLTQNLALLPPLLIFGGIPKCFDTAVSFFLILTVCCQCWSRWYRVSVLSTKCERCYPKGLIVASSCTANNNHNNNKNFYQHSFYIPVSIHLLAIWEKAKLNFSFSPTIVILLKIYNTQKLC